MPLNFKKSNKLSDFPVYTKIDKAAYKKLNLKLYKRLGNLSSVLNIDVKQITGSEDILLEIFERIEKRRIYFHIFYDGCEMGELNEGALLCFWITKLQPFFHPKFATSKLNAKIALCIFINSIYYYYDVVKKENKIPDNFVKDLYYSLLYRDISKEALMVLAESFINDSIH